MTVFLPAHGKESRSRSSIKTKGEAVMVGRREGMLIFGNLAVVVAAVTAVAIVDPTPALFGVLAVQLVTLATALLLGLHARRERVELALRVDRLGQEMRRRGVVNDIAEAVASHRVEVVTHLLRYEEELRGLRNALEGIRLEIEKDRERTP